MLSATHSSMPQAQESGSAPDKIWPERCGHECARGAHGRQEEDVTAVVRPRACGGCVVDWSVEGWNCPREPWSARGGAPAGRAGQKGRRRAANRRRRSEECLTRGCFGQGSGADKVYLCFYPTPASAPFSLPPRVPSAKRPASRGGLPHTHRPSASRSPPPRPQAEPALRSCDQISSHTRCRHPPGFSSTRALCPS